MAVNIRLTPEIDSLARAYCERVGISLNALVGVALDAYLQRPRSDPNPGPSVPVASPPSAPTPAVERPASPPPAPWEKPILTAPRLAPTDPKPVLKANPSKAERSRLADWHRRNPAS